MKSSIFGIIRRVVSWKSIYVSEEEADSACNLLHGGFLLCLFFDPETWRWHVPRNVGWLSTNYAMLYPRRQNSSKELVFSHKWSAVRVKTVRCTTSIHITLIAGVSQHSYNHDTSVYDFTTDEFTVLLSPTALHSLRLSGRQMVTIK
jgi:hypothetical protein